MKVRLKVLPNKPRDSAWPPSVRAVKCSVKSVNEQDLYPHLLTFPFGRMSTMWDCLGNKEEGVGNGRSVCFESTGLHARDNDRNNGLQL